MYLCITWVVLVTNKNIDKFEQFILYLYATSIE